MITKRNIRAPQAGPLHVVRDEPVQELLQGNSDHTKLVLYPGEGADSLLDAYPVYSLSTLIFHRKFIVKLRAGLLVQRDPDFGITAATRHYWDEESKAARSLLSYIKSSENLKQYITPLIKENVSLLITLIQNVMIPASKEQLEKYHPYWKMVDFFTKKTPTGQYVQGKKVEVLKFEDITGPDGWEFILDREMKLSSTTQDRTVERLLKTMKWFRSILEELFPDHPNNNKNYDDYDSRITGFKKYLESKNKKKQGNQGEGYKQNSFLTDENAKKAFESSLNSFFSSSPFDWKEGEEKVTFKGSAGFLGKCFNLIYEKGVTPGHDENTLTEWIFERVQFLNRYGKPKKIKESTIRDGFSRAAALTIKEKRIAAPLLNWNPKATISH
jgi:hypothetical protein